jgi:choline kinase
MAGKSQRFRDAGYTIPKYKIELKGKTIFEWSMESLEDFRRQTDRYIFITRLEDQARDFIVEACGKLGISNYEILELDYDTDGQATTCLVSKSLWDSSQPLFIYNIDTYVEAGNIQRSDLRGNGTIPCFNALGDHWSFVKCDEMGRAVQVTEKQRISDNCSIGAYYFKSGSMFESLYNTCFSDEANLVNKEKYIAPMYNYLIRDLGDVYMSQLTKEAVHCLGTPKEVEAFLKNQ